MRIQNIDARVRFLRVKLFIKGCVLALVLTFIMVITRFHTRVSREGLCNLICGNFLLFGNSVNILFTYSERLGVSFIKFWNPNFNSFCVCANFVCTAQKSEVFHYRFLQQMWTNPQETADLVTFTEEICNGKLHFFVQCLLVTTCYLHVSYHNMKLKLTLRMFFRK